MDTIVEESVEAPAPNIVCWSSSELEDRVEFEPDSWWCCIYCERFFQARHVRDDGDMGRQKCALCECGGIGVALWPWDAHRGPDWTIDEDDLQHGMAMPGARTAEERAAEKALVRRAIEATRTPPRRPARKRRRRRRLRR